MMRPLIGSAFGFVIALVACSSSSDGSGGACVPGAAAMCWCDGIQQGVQECQPDMTFAQCICDGEGGSDGSGAADGVDDDGGGTGGADGVPMGTSASGPDDGGDVDSTDGGGSADSAGASDGDPDGGGTEGCTDERFSYYLACRYLAAVENPSPCPSCSGEDNSCLIAQCALDCAAQGNPEYDDALAACDENYPECSDVIQPTPVDPYVACVQACSAQNQECLAEAGPACDPADVSACSAPYSACVGAC